MSTLRLPFAVAGGVLFSSAVFLALWRFVSVPLDIGEQIKAQRIDFTRQRVDTPVEIKRQHKVDRPPPPVVPIATTIGPDDPRVTTTVVHTPPLIPVVPTGHGAPGIGGADRDVIPIVRVPPDYPARAAAGGIEGWVQVQFTITAAGTVRDAVVVAAAPKGWFEDAALKAIVRWRYNPRVDGGVAVERVGLQTVIRFELPK
jgi:periplasmic protein TonB